VLAAPFPACAQVAPLEVRIDSETSEISFPKGITFNLRVSSERSIERIELIYQKAADETLYLDEPKLEPAATVELTYALDLQVYYAPPGIDITYRWRFVSEDGATFTTDERTLLWSDTRFEWTEQEAGLVSVSSYSGDTGFDQFVLETAQATLSRLEADFEITLDRPVRIWLYSSRSDFAGARAPNSESWAVGLAMPIYQVIIAAIEPGDQWSVGRTIPHEIAHQALFQVARNPFNIPAQWFNEGFAGLFQLEGAAGFDETVAEAAAERKLWSLRSLISQFPFDPEGVTLAYAQSAEVTRFIIERWGKDAIKHFIDAYALGSSHDDALLSAIGVDTEGLDALWRESRGFAATQGVIGSSGREDGPTAGQILIIESGAVLLTLSAVVAMVWRLRRRRATDWGIQASDDPMVA
jgi:hypothetical protein